MTGSTARPRSPNRRPSGAAPPDIGARLRVLFVGEGSTLAHAARPIALASALPQDRYDIVVACPEAYFRWIPDRIARAPLATQPRSRFLSRVANGKPPFDEATLHRYVADDLDLIARTRPDIVVGDARISLAASARVAGTPYIALSNAYWHPPRRFRPEMPVLSWTKRLPTEAMQAVFALTWPLAFGWTAAPIQRALAAYGIDVGGDMRRAWTEADLTLYADLPQMFPDVVPDDRYRFLGPLAWEPPVALPSWWGQVPGERPIAYVTVGSSGDVGALTVIVQALAELGWTALVATAGRAEIDAEPGKVFVAEFLPGLMACAKADLVICNGGSPTTTQAMLAGRPVLGVCSNADQFLNMQAVEATGAGRTLRADRLTQQLIGSRLDQLRTPACAEAARTLAADAGDVEPSRILMDAIDELSARSERAVRP